MKTRSGFSLSVPIFNLVCAFSIQKMKFQVCILNLQRCFNLAVQSIKSIKIQNYRKRVRFSFSPFRFSDLSFAKNTSKIQSIQSNIFRIFFIRADCQSKQTIDEELVWFIQFNYFDEICRWQFVQLIESVILNL